MNDNERCDHIACRSSSSRTKAAQALGVNMSAPTLSSGVSLGVDSNITSII